MADPLIYILDTAIFIGIFSMLSISLNLQFGFTNMSNFGVVAFFMIGAYTSALLTAGGYAYIIAMLLAAALAGISGVLVSIPALRLRGDYLAIAMTGLAAAIALVFKNETWIAGGVFGMITTPVFLIGNARAQMIAELALVYGVVVVFFVLAQLIANSPYGRVLRAIREDELAAQVFGKNIMKYKAQMFGLGSAMAGVAGSLFAQYVGFIDPSSFDTSVTFMVWIMVMMGGPANNIGSVIGAAIVELFDRGARAVKDYIPPSVPLDPNNFRVMLIGVLIILVILYRPQGILPESRIRSSARRNEVQQNG